MRKIVTICLLALLTGKLIAQVFPVQSSLQITPPYSINLPDYVASGSDRMALNVILTDAARAQLDVQLRFRIEGEGIRIETNRAYNPPRTSLVTGFNNRLIAADLEPYFRAQNLVFQGMSAQQYINRGGALPEGVYRFCVDVLEYNRDIKISRTACVTAWLILNDPPLINLPAMNAKLEPSDPQFVRFQWTPRHTGSPNSVFSTEYEFQLVEVWPQGRNPNDAMLTTAPIYETTTFATSIILGPAEPPLVRGRQYAFRVRAKSKVGVEQLDLFRNDGYSEVQTFTYGDECLAPKKLTLESVSSKKIQANWENDGTHTGYEIRYRREGESDWIEETVLFDDYAIGGLIPDTFYEVQVSGACGFAKSDLTKVERIKTQAEVETDFDCGTPPEEFNIDNTNPLPLLQQGDVFYAGDFDIEVIEVSGGNGRFSGLGQMSLPMMNSVNMGMTFRDIAINDEYRMTAGEVIAITNPDKELFGGGDEGGSDDDPSDLGDEEVSDAGDTLNTDDGFDGTEVVFEEEVDSVYTDDNGDIVVITADGETEVITRETDEDGNTEDTLVTDGAGNTWTVDGEGNVTQGGGSTGGGSTSGDSDTDPSDSVVTAADTLTIDGLSTDLNLVSINEIPETFKLKEERMRIVYTIRDTLNLSFDKLEIFKLEDEDTVLVTSYNNIDLGEDINFVDTQDHDSIGWSGKDSEGNYVSAGQYLLAITATIEAEFENGFEEFQEMEIEPFDISITEDVDFVGFDQSDAAGCYRRAADMLETAGYETVPPTHVDVVQMTQVNDEGVLTAQDDIEDGIALINEYLDNEIPVMVGVDYHTGHPGNIDETTDHWLVIVGRTTTNNQTCFRYYDAQTAHLSIGTGTDNQLCEQDDHTLTDIFREGTQYERTYTVTMVRPSVEIEE